MWNCLERGFQEKKGFMKKVCLISFLILGLFPHYSALAMNVHKSVTKLPRIFYQNLPSFRKGEVFEINDPSVVHYLSDVMRLKPGSGLRVFNEHYGEYVCQIQRSEDVKKARRKDHLPIPIEITDQYRLAADATLPLSRVSLNLIFSPIRKEKMKVVFEKATELGVSTFQPVSTLNCQHQKIFQNDDKDIESFRNIIVSSCEQCERLTIPRILPFMSLQHFLEHQSQQVNDNNILNFVLVCRERSLDSLPIVSMLQQSWNDKQSFLKKFLTDNSKKLNISVFVGPEGGFKEEELSLLSKNGKWKFVSLGTNILKSETASITALSAVRFYLDSWQRETQLVHE
jgi:16S rRNA (uracil1498-N3)-methyltransferase